MYCSHPLSFGWRGFILPAIACVLVAGCGKAGPKRYPASGEVRWNGKPIVEGQITLLALPGKKRVEVVMNRVTAPAVPGKFDLSREGYIPRRYNVDSQLTADVTDDSNNHFTFDLSEKPEDNKRR